MAALPDHLTLWAGCIDQ